MRGSCGSLPRVVTVTALALAALALFSVSFGQTSDSGAKTSAATSEERSATDTGTGVSYYEVSRKAEIAKHKTSEKGNLGSSEVFMSRDGEINDNVDLPTWKSPDKVVDRKQDMPKVKKIWHRVRQDPAVDREKYEINRAPYFMGRNSIPLSEAEQIVLDTPDLIKSKENPKLKMVSRTLGRGVINTFGGYLEIPRRVGITIKETDPVTGIVIGGIEGVGFGTARTCAGVFEVGRGAIDFVFFPFKTPEALDHRVMIYPENIVTEMWNDPVPILTEPHYNWQDPVIKTTGYQE